MDGEVVPGAVESRRGSPVGEEDPALVPAVVWLAESVEGQLSSDSVHCDPSPANKLFPCHFLVLQREDPVPLQQ